MTIGHYFLIYLAGYFVSCFALTRFITYSSSPPQNDEDWLKAVTGVMVLSFAWPIIIVFVTFAWIGIHAAALGLKRKTRKMVRTTMNEEE